MLQRHSPRGPCSPVHYGSDGRRRDVRVTVRVTQDGAHDASPACLPAVQNPSVLYGPGVQMGLEGVALAASSLIPNTGAPDLRGQPTESRYKRSRRKASPTKRNRSVRPDRGRPRSPRSDTRITRWCAWDDLGFPASERQAHFVPSTAYGESDGYVFVRARRTERSDRAS